MLLISLLLLVVLNLAFTFAQQPNFYFPPGTSDSQKQQFYQAFRDAITLARFAATTGDPCDQAFRRYFQPQDYDFVQNIFKEIANIPIAENPNPMDISRLVSRSEFNPNFTSLSISLGNHPLWTSEVTGRCDSDPRNGGVLGRLVTQFWAGVQYQGLMAICPQSILFSYLGSLQETENPPAWARANRDPNGQPLPGFGCGGLSDHDSSLMLVLGAVFLHEMLHWPRLVRWVPDYDKLIPLDQYGQPTIVDFVPSPGQYPPAGYGPLYAKTINEGQPLNPQTGKSASIQNSDNYVWYALSKYWSFKCGRVFGPSFTQYDMQTILQRMKPP